MLREKSVGERPVSGAVAQHRRSRRWRSRRGVSEVVATILLLALTVTLFASIFAFVTSFPAPPAQNSNQFQAKLIIQPNATGTGGPITGISILHLAGPQVSQQALIYLKSSLHPTWTQFGTPYTLTQGGVSGVWSLGQTWLLTSFAGGNDPWAPDNITIYIVANAQLIFSVVVPGAVLNIPPTFVNDYTTPTSPAVGQAFTISAVIQGITSANTVQVTLSGLPGMSGVTAAQPLNYSAATGLWSTSFVRAGLTTSTGSYYVFLTASSSTGKTATSALPVYITPYSTLISSALTLGTFTLGAATCTAANTPAAACQASGDHYATVTISSSSITFGSVSFEVYTTASYVAYTTAGHTAFALATTAALTTSVVSWVGPAKGPMLVNSTWTTTYKAGYSALSPLTTSFIFSMDLGTAAVPATLSFIVIGIGAYSSST